MSFRHALPAAGLSAVALSAVGVPPAVPAANASQRQDRFDRTVVRQVNAVRRAFHLPPVHRSRALARAADAHSREMVRANVLSHLSPDGTPMGRRVRHFVHARTVGETIAWVPSGTRGEAGAVFRAWMASPEHRAVLLDPAFRRVGVGKRVGRLGGGRWAVTTLNMASAR